MFLSPLAFEIATRHLREFPDEADRYGEAGFEWCVHDVKYLLWWAALDPRALLLREQLRWLVRVLESREYPRDRLARALDISADVVLERHTEDGVDIAAALRSGAESLRH